jgi:nicotinate-nucleotide pyrophosphorylase (carboxylating)
LEKKILDQFIQNALKEDVGNGDHTSLSTIPPNATGKAKLIIKENGIISGVTVALEIFKTVDPNLKVDVKITDGCEVKINDIALYVSGNSHSILIAERLVLNTMQRMSGISTTTRRIVDLLNGTHTKVLDTRKTTPNIRFLEKEAVKIGGGVNHRFGLYDMILIKDNHVDYAGGIENAIKSAQKYKADNKLNIQIEIEVRNLLELDKVLKTGGIDRILLDNFNFDDVKTINRKFKTEASGNITEQNALDYAKCGVDYISIGALTHSIKSLDMSLKAII